MHPGAIRVAFAGGGGPPPDPGLIRSGRTWRYLDDGSNPGATWREADFPDALWKSGPSPLGYGDDDEATVVSFVDANPTQAGVQKNATTFFRTDFAVTDPAAFERLRLTLTYDDAAAVYLNGSEVLRTDNLAAAAGVHDYASGSVPDNTVLSREDVSATRLRPGRNVVAVEVHQSDGASSDLSFDLRLDGILAGSGVVHTLAAEDVDVALEFAGEVAGPWRREPGLFVLVREERTPGQAVRQTFRLEPTMAATATVFVRLAVNLAP